MFDYIPALAWSHMVDSQVKVTMRSRSLWMTIFLGCSWRAIVRTSIDKIERQGAQGIIPVLTDACLFCIATRVPSGARLFVEGIPLFFLELSLGQFMKKGAFGTFKKIHPALGKSFFEYIFTVISLSYIASCLAQPLDVVSSIISHVAQCQNLCQFMPING